MIPPLDWAASSAALAQSDPRLGALLSTLGGTRLESRGEPFSCLVRAIVGQQISVRAADTVWHRLMGLLGPDQSGSLQPIALLRRADDLRSVGLSGRKVSYLLALAERFHQTHDLSQQLAGMPDDAVIRLLTELPGIGPWTAQMFLIFTLMRPDVFPADDLGVLKAIGLLYADEFPRDWANRPLRQRQEQALDFSRRWVPHRTVATWLLWRSIDPVPVAY